MRRTEAISLNPLCNWPDIAMKLGRSRYSTQWIAPALGANIISVPVKCHDERACVKLDLKSTSAPAILDVRSVAAPGFSADSSVPK